MTTRQSLSEERGVEFTALQLGRVLLAAKSENAKHLEAFVCFENFLIQNNSILYSVTIQSHVATSSRQEMKVFWDDFGK